MGISVMMELSYCQLLLSLRYHEVIRARPRTYFLPCGPADMTSEFVSKSNLGFSLPTSLWYWLPTFRASHRDDPQPHCLAAPNLRLTSEPTDSCLSSRSRWLPSLAPRQHSSLPCRNSTRDVAAFPFSRMYRPGAGIVNSAPMQC